MKFNWETEEQKILRKMHPLFDAYGDMSFGQIENLYDNVQDYLEFDWNGEPTAQGAAAESMIDKLARVMWPKTPASGAE